MKKKGFTLIELLAVIVVLAIIAIIATPMVLNTIDEARKGSAKSSGYGYINGLETSLASYMLRNNGNHYSAGKYDVSTLNADLNVTVKGDAPSEGKVCVASNGTVTKASLKVSGYIVSYDGKEVKNTDKKEVEDIKCDGEVALVGDPILDKAKSLVYDDTGVCKTDGSTYNYMDGCYIKGTSTNNYVWYNGFMWRIMGINSDNTVRLITDENVTVLSYSSHTAEQYMIQNGYIHDWLNEYFYNHLNSTKNIIKEGSYFCNEYGDSNGICNSKDEVAAKIGIISVDEYRLADTKNSYLNIKQNSWTMSPYSYASGHLVGYDGFVSGGTPVTEMYGVRPVINVTPTAIVTAGNGTTSNFYVLGEDKSINITGIISEKVTSGEYVSLEGKIYRVVNKDNNGVKLILDGFYEETEGTVYTMKYNETTGKNIFTLDSGIGAKLNGDVLTWLGLSDSDKIITTTYYQGDGVETKSPYTDTLKQSGGVEAKVGLIQVGDILAGQSSTVLTKNYTTISSYSNTEHYWVMNKYTSVLNAWTVNYMSNADGTDVKYMRGVRPVIVVKNNLNINGGTGTWNNPYQI